MGRQRRFVDEFKKQAWSDGYRSRAAYKLEQIDRKFRLFREGDTVIDLCAAPGGWSQYVHSKVGSGRGFVIAVDLVGMSAIPGVVTIRGDVTREELVEKILEVTDQRKVEVVVSDCSPSVSGNWSFDHARQIFLAESVLRIVKEALKSGGSLVVKVFQGDLFDDFVNQVKECFGIVRLFKPKASRKESAEIYIIAKGFLF